MAGLKVRNVSILAKVEATYGVDPTPVAADGFYAAGTAPKMIQTSNPLDDVIGRGTLSKLPGAQPGPRHYQVDFRVPVRGAGAVYSATVKPKVSTLMRGASWQEVIVTTAGLETVTYTPRSAGQESITIYYNLDGMLYKLVGCRGNTNLVIRTGGIAFLECSFQGKMATPVDTALVTVTGEPTVQFPTLMGGAFQIGTENFAAKFNQINFNMNNVLVASVDPSDAHGVGSIESVDRNPDGSFDPEAVLVATFPWYTKFLNGLLMDLSFTMGSVQYNKITVTCGKVQAKDLVPGDRSLLGMFQVPFRISSDSVVGDDEISILFN